MLLSYGVVPDFQYSALFCRAGRDLQKNLQTHYQKKLYDLEELKKSILQKAFAGELKTEKMVEEMEEVEL